MINETENTRLIFSPDEGMLFKPRNGDRIEITIEDLKALKNLASERIARDHEDK